MMKKKSPQRRKFYSSRERSYKEGGDSSVCHGARNSCKVFVFKQFVPVWGADIPPVRWGTYWTQGHHVHCEADHGGVGGEDEGDPD